MQACESLAWNTHHGLLCRLSLQPSAANVSTCCSPTLSREESALKALKAYETCDNAFKGPLYYLSFLLTSVKKYFKYRLSRTLPLSHTYRSI